MRADVQCEVMTEGINPLAKIASTTLSKLVKERWEGSQEDLAARIGVHQTHVSAILRGTKLPSLPIAVELAKALETNLDFIVGLTNDSKPATDLEDQVVFEVRDPALRREMQEVAAMLRELTPEQLRTVRELMKMITPRKPRIIGGE